MQAFGDATKEGKYAKHGDTDEEVAFAPEPVAKKARDRQHNAIGHQVGRQGPGRLIV